LVREIIIDFIYIDNLVDGIITLMQKSKGHEIYFLSDEQSYVLSELINEIKLQLNTNPRIIRFPYFLLYPFAWIAEKFGKLIHRNIGFNIEFIKGMATNAYHFSIEKALKVGYSPKISTKEGIERTIQSLE